MRSGEHIELLTSEYDKVIGELLHRVEGKSEGKSEDDETEKVRSASSPQHPVHQSLFAHLVPIPCSYTLFLYPVDTLFIHLCTRVHTSRTPPPYPAVSNYTRSSDSMRF